MAKEGSLAPTFALRGVDGKDHSLSDYKGKTVVLYFYPKDDTTGCTIEAKEFTTMLGDFEKQNAVVLGVSADNYDSHCKFRDKYKLKVQLLSDPTLKTIKSYDAYGDKGIFGDGIIRTTYLIDKDGKIIKSWKRVHALGHAKAVLDFVKGM